MMNSNMIIAIVPHGYAEKVLKAAKEANAPGGTIIKGRGAVKSMHEGIINFNVEPEEEIILIVTEADITESVCSRINEEFNNETEHGGTLYVLPVNLKSK